MDRFAAQRWPDEVETLLLRAALAPDARAIDAWREWRRHDTLDALDGGAYELAPLVLRNLTRLGFEDDETPRLQGIARRTWYRNQLLIHAGAQAAEALQRSGIPVMFLKGVPLLLHYYRDVSLRPMADADFAVPESAAREAAGILAGEGWRPMLRPNESLDDAVLVLHAVGMERAGAAIDLHWHVLEESCGRGADAAFWEAAAELTLHGRAVSMLNAPDLLLHVCVHGSRGYPARVLRWIPDSLQVLAAEGDSFDWERLVAQARKRQLTAAMEHALDYLVTVHAAPVPESVLAQLRRSRRGALERLDYRAQGSPDTVYWSVVRDVARYARLSAGRPASARLVGFPVYLRRLWGLDSLWEVPLEGCRRVGRRLWQVRLRFWRTLAPR